MAWAVNATIGPLPTMLAEPSRGFVAVHFRHLDVHQDQIVRSSFSLRLLGQVAGHAAVFGHIDFQLRLPQQQAKDPLNVGVIFHQQHSAVQREGRLSGRQLLPRPAGCLRRLQHASAFRLSDVDRQGERAPLAQLADDLDVAAQRLGEAFGDGQAEARAAVATTGGRIRLREGLEQFARSCRQGCQCRCRKRRTAVAWAGPPPRKQRRAMRTSPCSVNLTALPTRFTRIWRSRAGSVWIFSGSGTP